MIFGMRGSLLPKGGSDVADGGAAVGAAYFGLASGTGTIVGAGQQ
jgi:hypothetical protein